MYPSHSLGFSSMIIAYMGHNVFKPFFMFASACAPINAMHVYVVRFDVETLCLFFAAHSHRQYASSI